MSKFVSRSCTLALVALVAFTALGFAQGKYRERAHMGPYRVFLSRPIVGLGYTAGSLYREHEYLGAMFNELAAQGMDPVFTDVLTQTLEGREDEQRLIVVCRQE